MPDETKRTAEAPPETGTAPAPSDRDTGSALRSVYQRTVDEAIPDEMLDLLGKLD